MNIKGTAHDKRCPLTGQSATVEGAIVETYLAVPDEGGTMSCGDEATFGSGGIHGRDGQDLVSHYFGSNDNLDKWEYVLKFSGTGTATVTQVNSASGNTYDVVVLSSTSAEDVVASGVSGMTFSADGTYYIVLESDSDTQIAEELDSFEVTCV